MEFPGHQVFLHKLYVKAFVPNAHFLYRKIFCFHEVEKGCIGNEWVKTDVFIY